MTKPEDRIHVQWYAVKFDRIPKLLPALHRIHTLVLNLWCRNVITCNFYVGHNDCDWPV